MSSGRVNGVQPNGVNIHSSAARSLHAAFPVSADTRPPNVGIHGLEVYLPKRCISESDLERFDNVPAGKYTIGLGQEYMAFVDDREDIHSFMLTAVSSLLRKYNVDPRSVGRLEVGTETVIDKSKAAKTVLMDLFTEAGNFDIEGVDSKQACYGGTAAVFNCVNWVESSSWDGRWAIVVAGDIAIYADGAARPVGGAGAVALLIGPDAPLIIEPVHGTSSRNSWDFYKPALASEYPEVDGRLTQSAYLNAVEDTYNAWRQKEARRLRCSPGDLSLDSLDFVAWHGPYGKIVQKGYSRLLYHDFLANPSAPQFAAVDPALVSVPPAKTLLDKDVEKTFIGLAKDHYRARVWPTTQCMRRLGNSYSSTIWCSLASLIDAEAADSLVGKRIGLFSYGSGLQASFFTVKVAQSPNVIRDALDLRNRLASMKVRPCEEYVKALNLREEKHNAKDYEPEGSLDDLFPGTYYLVRSDGKYRRTYAVKPSA